MGEQKLKYQPLTYHQKDMLRRRGLDPKNFVVVKNTYSLLYLRDVRDGSIRIIAKMN